MGSGRKQYSVGSCVKEDLLVGLTFALVIKVHIGQAHRNISDIEISLYRRICLAISVIGIDYHSEEQQICLQMLKVK